jgi:hypothetical protein
MRAKAEVEAEKEVEKEAEVGLIAVGINPKDQKNQDTMMKIIILILIK